MTSSNHTVVRVGAVAPAVMNVPVWIAVEAGAFAQRGIRIESSFIGSTQGTTDALLSGQIDIALSSPDPALDDPSVVRILAGLVDRPPLSLIAQPELSTYENLRGRRLGTTSLREGTVQLVRAMLSPHGLFYPGDYDFVMAGAHPQRWAALQEGRIDAALQLMPFDYMAEEAGFSVLGRAEETVSEFAFSSVCVTAAFQSANVDLVNRFHEALLVGEGLVRSDQDRAARLVSEVVHVEERLAQRCVRRLVDGGLMPVGLVHSASALERTRQAMVDGRDIAGGTLLLA